MTSAMLVGENPSVVPILTIRSSSSSPVGSHHHDVAFLRGDLADLRVSDFVCAAVSLGAELCCCGRERRRIRPSRNTTKPLSPTYAHRSSPPERETMTAVDAAGVSASTVAWYARSSSVSGQTLVVVPGKEVIVTTSM
nr:unnamed protein product [Digitaria exilis]